jgi:putative transposase
MTAFTKLKLVNAQADQKTPMVVRRSKLTGKLDLQIALAKAQTEGADFVASRKKTVIDRETGLKKRVDAAMTVRQWWWTNQAGAVVLGLRYGSKPIEIAKGIEVPRDRHGSFQPQLIPKHQTRWAGFDDKIISLYARGMTVREIQAHLEEMYGTEVSPSLISSVTDAVADEVKAWQARPLEPIYPIVYLDCIHVKVREGAVRVKAVYLAIGITMTGEKEVLGLWLAQTEGAKFWLQVVTELRNRGVQDIFIACVDGLKGFPDAIEAVFPKAVVQLCIVHMVRHSLNYVSWKRRKEVAADLRRIYTATTAEEAELMLGEFEARWDAEYLPIGQSWRRNWSRLTPFFDYPPEIRKVIYTTNAIESVNMSLRKLTKNRGSFPSDEALTKLFYLALRNISQKWTMPIRDWKAALTRFTIQFGDRISVN